MPDQPEVGLADDLALDANMVARAPAIVLANEHGEIVSERA
jgi:hypothetical protein